MLEAAGFAVEKERSRRDIALAFFREQAARAAQSGPPILGIHVLMGADASQKMRNMVAKIEQGVIAPVEIISRAV